MLCRSLALISCLAGLNLLLVAAAWSADEPFRDPRLPVEQRIQDLLGRMTLEEKVAQLQQFPIFGCEAVAADFAKKTIGEKELDAAFKGISYGAVFSPIGVHARDTLRLSKAVHEYGLKHTRLGVPMINLHCTMHGVLALDTTVFPQFIAQAATWNPELVQEMAAAIGQEAAALGLSHGMGPGLELARDPRWGRVEETYGECPYLSSRLCVAFVKGIQGENAWQGIPPDRIATVAYWTCGSSTPAAGLNTAACSVGERELRSLYFMPHEAAIKEGHLTSVMASYNTTDGIPSHANRWALTTVLRDEWGFKGYIYCDWGGIALLEQSQHIARSPAEAGMLALKAGVDLEAAGGYAYPHLVEMVRQGRIAEKYVDLACSRILRLKFVLGLFDGMRTFPTPEELPKLIHTPAHVTLARRMAEESVILLKNEKNLLPLVAAKLKSVAVIGPNANQVEYGDYSASKDNSSGVTVLGGIRNLLKDSGVAVRYARGCDFLDGSTAGFAAAVAAAQKSDVAIVVIGDTSSTGVGTGTGETDPNFLRLATVGEACDRFELMASGVQDDLVKTVVATGKPTVVVMVQGRPLSEPWMKEHIPAILSVFYPGEQGGTAVAEILFGRINPSGRLPVSVVQTAGHIPTTYDYAPQGRGNYLGATSAPLWSFGYGLSYTSFEYSDLKIETPTIDPAGTVRFSFNVKNTSTREGREVAQVYYHEDFTSVVTPLKRLIRFHKVDLMPGETRRVEFSIPASEMAVWNVAMKRVVEPGTIELMVGPAAEDEFIKLRGKFEVK
ncbi:MAG: glycoside hydrolase family 3 C-terminal domain-containing protein [Thermoguttaceae bacterium]